MLEMVPPDSKALTPAMRRQQGSTVLPTVRWLNRGLWAAALLILVLLFVFLIDTFAPGEDLPIVRASLFALSVGVAASTVWLLLKARQFARHEVLLREAFHSVLIPQVITDEDGTAIMANRAFMGWIDVGSGSAEEALSNRFAENSAALAEFRQLQKTARSGQMAVAELPVTRGNKVIEWRRITVRQLIGWSDLLLWRLEDVSERRRMERAMREEQAKLVDFMASAPVGIYSVDQAGRFRFANRTLAEWLGCKPEDLINSNLRLHDVLNNAPKETAAHIISAGPDGEYRGEAMMRGKDGKLFPVAITQTIAVGDDGKTLRTRSIVRNLMPEQEWQEALSHSEKRFQRLFAQAPIGVALLDKELKIVECNQALVTLSKRTRESLNLLPLSDLLREKEREAVAKRLQEVMDGRDIIKPLEVHLIAERDLTMLLYAKRFAISTQERAQDGQETGLVLYFIDTTEQKKLEMQFAQSQKMQAIGQLAGGIAHDFNNLLTAMIGFCDLLLQRHKPGDQSFSDIMQIKQNGNRAANLVRQLLAFSRQQTLQPKVLNLVDVLSDLSNLMRRLIGPTIKLDIVHGRDLKPVKVDQVQFEQVIVNLVVNARDAMPQGGAITVTTGNWAQKNTILRGQDEMPPGDYVMIEVQDTGTGIPKDVLAHIFEPFFTTKEVGQGTGLGLSTVYGIVRQTGGFIGVETEVGKGTKFIIYLPVHHETEKTEPQASSSEEAIDKPSDLTGVGTILLVEDEDAVRVFSARALRNKGYKVLEARNGEEALEVIEREGSSIELMVSDVVMPQMDGPTLFQKVKEKWPKLAVIFISGYAEDKFRDQLKSGEVVHFLGKPFTLKQLAGKVKEVFDLKT